MVAPALVLIVLLSATAVSAWPPAGARVTLGASMIAIAVAALLSRPAVAEAAYWLAAGTLCGAGAASAVRAVFRRRPGAKREW